MGSNNWGQININFVNQRGLRLRGASSYWRTRNRSAPLSLSPLWLGINVDLTPIVLQCACERMNATQILVERKLMLIHTKGIDGHFHLMHLQ